MNLAELMTGLVDDDLVKQAPEIKGLALDSRKVQTGFVFIALSGAVEHGLNYVEQAIANGAAVILYEPEGSDVFRLEEIDCYKLKVDLLAEKLGCIAERFYQSPSRMLDVIGVTGTNGKTSCSQFLIQLLENSAVIGTLGWGDKDYLHKTINTTPDALDIQQILAEFVALKKQQVVMEVSSHGLEQGRVNGLSFKAAVFTNLSREHLDYHGTMEAYLNAKLMLFKRPELEIAVINLDDEYAAQFLAATADDVKKWTYSAKGKTTELAESVLAENIHYSLKGIEFEVRHAGIKVSAKTQIVGDFNLENMLAVLTVMLAQGYSLEVAVKKLADLQPVAGRMEAFGGEDRPFVFVDYAHTPDALEKLLQGLRKYSSESLWLVFGCGGNRDKGKRVEMGRVADRLADEIMITNDNPRLENAQLIVNDILQGFKQKHPQQLLDREQAIHSVISKAKKGDCVVIAGKGHENYQDIKGVKYPFSDQQVVKQALSVWAE